MPSWNDVGTIFQSSDLILVCRKKDRDVVKLRSDPKSLLSSFSAVHVSPKASLEVRYKDKLVFGHEVETKIATARLKSLCLKNCPVTSFFVPRVNCEGLCVSFVNMDIYHLNVP